LLGILIYSLFNGGRSHGLSSIHHRSIFPSSSILPSCRSQLSFAAFGWLFEMLMLLDISQNAGFFAGFIEPA
jgi:hypothetical protein